MGTTPAHAALHPVAAVKRFFHRRSLHRAEAAERARWAQARNPHGSRKVTPADLEAAQTKYQAARAAVIREINLPRAQRALGKIVRFEGSYSDKAIVAQGVVDAWQGELERLTPPPPQPAVSFKLRPLEP
jgi:hypothetical protein